MKKHLVVWTLLFVLVLGILTGCSTKNEFTPVELPKLEKVSQQSGTADGYDILGGSWVVAGFYYRNKLVDLSDNDSLEDIYDNVYLSFYEGGTFHYMNIYNSRGKYIRQNDNSFVLKTDTVFTYDFAEEGLKEKVLEDADKTSYIISIIDENTLRWNILDPATGREKSDSDPLLFEREDIESAYIQQYKTPLGDGKTESSAANEKEKPSIPKDNYSSRTESKASSTQNTTSGMRNALKSAKNYLDVMPFSHSGLIEQLEYEGYSYSEAKYAADNCGANWKEQAAISAQNYLDIMPFSRQSLIEQLEYEGYTHEQAVYGVNKVY